MLRLILCSTLMLTLAACAGDRGLRDLRTNGGGPDEFRVQPMGQLVMPSDVTNLPTPTPGQTNLAFATVRPVLAGSVAAIATFRPTPVRRLMPTRNFNGSAMPALLRRRHPLSNLTTPHIRV